MILSLWGCLPSVLAVRPVWITLDRTAPRALREDVESVAGAGASAVNLLARTPWSFRPIPFARVYLRATTTFRATLP